MEHTECHNGGHECVPAYLRASRPLRIFTELYVGIERNKIRDIERTIELITAKHSLTSPPGDITLEEEIRDVWAMLFDFVIHTKFNNPMLDSAVLLLINLTHSVPITQEVHDPNSKIPQIIRNLNKVWKDATGKDMKIFVKKRKPTPKTRESSDGGDPPSDTSEGGILLPTTEEDSDKPDDTNKENGKAGKQDENENCTSTGATLPDSDKNGVSGTEVPIVREIIRVDGHALWTELPLLHTYLDAQFLKIGRLERKQRCSLTSFLGRIIAGGLGYQYFSCMALWFIRETLETPRAIIEEEVGSDEDEYGSYSQEDEAKNKKRQAKEKRKREQDKYDTMDKVEKEFANLTLNDLLFPCITLFATCSKTLAALSVSSPTINGPGKNRLTNIGELATNFVKEKEEGFSIQRWMFWKSRLKKIASLGVQPLSRSARLAFNLLCNSGRFSGIELPGDREFMKRSLEYLPEQSSLVDLFNSDLNWIDEEICP
ncbi:hypothetical protein H112_05299 [Trichophyton rubrum D6]|uniref:Uncharacterized protein n=4 Tax=Trichophyton TaxID=5550 RepID=A0A178EPE9_TRIRU|nr:uncharacterized protein TERG_03046 [Trichophyton rubrum CBS 118892]EZF19710.1 hypothetical protein H100_05322 [Trichophyton rubrum MR850]EZF40834.1 hypothetical protein H102_05310 [Trichophyton rubrum CBS 100081]EZF51452.1 hypothetical protein H103_05312 [Trichophyton rubrum CBS 288.86]EZF62035.1 hypothetical protein H104_05302 [Trichophyton rubrum CBS 289.86]EZF72726.1 hypothetical protein H105_05330 [Trichophyton soudanense CBS 452.61]EZF83323.1 hypothetical protein H110_05309 [Trichophy